MFAMPEFESIGLRLKKKKDKKTRENLKRRRKLKRKGKHIYKVTNIRFYTWADGAV